MRTLSQLVFGVLCVVVSAGVCAAQKEPAKEGKVTVQGKVAQESDGQGIRKVTVQLHGGNRDAPLEYTTATDAAGQFKFEGVPPGQYTVLLTRTSYVTLSKTRHEAMITVEGGQDVTDLAYKMQATGLITGKIVDVDGDPVPNVAVEATRTGKAGPGRGEGEQGQGVTNDVGEYRISDLRAGQYLVRAEPSAGNRPTPNPAEQGHERERAVYVNTYYPGTLEEKQASTVQVIPGGTATANIGVLMSHAYRVSGRVLGLGPAQMSQILLFSKSGQSGEQNLEEGGKFEFSSVQPGTYVVRVLLVTGLAEGKRPSMRFETIRTPVVVSTSDLVGLQLQPDAGGEVSGKFHAEGDEKINLTELHAMLLPVVESGIEVPGMGIEMSGAMTNLAEDGSFEIKDVPGGNYQLVVGSQSEKFRDYYTKSVLLDGREVVDTGFAVSTGTTLDVDVSAKGAAIEGTVVDSKGQPVPGAMVVTMPNSGKLGRPDSYQQDKTDERGHFLLRGINPGEFTVLALEDFSEATRSAEFFQKYGERGEKVKLEEGEKKSVVLTLLGEDGKGL